MMPSREQCLEPATARAELPLSTPDDPLAETGYRTLYWLGQGGMSEVFVAEHVELRATVVIKLLHSALVNRADLEERMRVEGQALAVLRHPNVVAVIDAGHTASGRPFLVMERLVGRTLGAELRARGSIPVAETLLIAHNLLAGLAAAHSLGIVHRDIKAENVLLHERRDGSRIAKILDFGVAKVLEGVARALPEPLSIPTEHGLLVGTPGYLSPEQAQGKPADQRSDLYAVAVLLYKMLTGRGPFDEFGRGTGQLRAHLHERPRSPSHYAKQPIGAGLDAVVLKALHKDPNHRFQTAAEFALALDAAETKSVAGRLKAALREPARSTRAAGSRSAAQPAADARVIFALSLVSGVTGGIVAAVAAWIMARILG